MRWDGCWGECGAFKGLFGGKGRFARKDLDGGWSLPGQILKVASFSGSGGSAIPHLCQVCQCKHVDPCHTLSGLKTGSICLRLHHHFKQIFRTPRRLVTSTHALLVCTRLDIRRCLTVRHSSSMGGIRRHRRVRPLRCSSFEALLRGAKAVPWNVCFGGRTPVEPQEVGGDRSWSSPPFVFGRRNVRSLTDRRNLRRAHPDSTILRPSGIFRDSEGYWRHGIRASIE